MEASYNNNSNFGSGYAFLPPDMDLSEGIEEHSQPPQPLFQMQQPLFQAQQPLFQMQQAQFPVQQFQFQPQIEQPLALFPQQMPQQQAIASVYKRRVGEADPKAAGKKASRENEYIAPRQENIMLRNDITFKEKMFLLDLFKEAISRMDWNSAAAWRDQLVEAGISEAKIEAALNEASPFFVCTNQVKPASASVETDTPLLSQAFEALDKMAPAPDAMNRN